MSRNAVVHARIDGAIKAEANEILAAICLAPSDAFRLMMTRIARWTSSGVRSWRPTRPQTEGSVLLPSVQQLPPDRIAPPHLSIIAAADERMDAIVGVARATLCALLLRLRLLLMLDDAHDRAEFRLDKIAPHRRHGRGA